MLGETGDWDGALSRITTMINGGSDPVEGLAHGFASGGLVEAYARQIEQDKGIELGMSIPVILAALSGATQGGFEAPMLQLNAKGEHYDWTPLVVQFIGVAEAGQSKSTLLREVEGSLRFALDRKGVDHRRKLIAAARKKAEGKHVGVTIEAVVFDKVYNQGGLCASSIADQGTQEGIRKMMSVNGGHRMILTAEPDVLAEVSQYQSKGKTGSLGLMLRGWGQENLDADRVQDPQSIKEPSLPFVILTQPESFNEHTGGGEERDRFVDRGVFSRTLLCKAERTPIADPADEDDEAWLSELDGTVDTSLMGTPLLKFRQDLQPVFDRLVERTNAYRVSKGFEAAWKQVAAIYNDLQRPDEVKRLRLALYPAGDPAARKKALLTQRSVQRLRARLIVAVRTANAANPGTATLLEPLAIRYTDHVMRIAALMSLADDPDATSIDADYMEDVATRIMPWLWANWWKVIQGRMEASARSLVETGVLRNARDLDTTGTERVLKALIYWEGRDGLASVGGTVESKIIDKATRRLPSGDATKAHFKKLLKQMAADGLIELVGKTESASKQAVGARYKITAAGRAELGEQASKS